MREINLVIAAMDEEVNGLLNELKEYNEVDLFSSTAYTFVINDEEYLLCKGKIGKVATGFFLGQVSQIYKIKRIFNIGTSGGINPDITTEEIVIATKVGYHDVDVEGFGYPYGQMPGCPLFFECDNKFIEEKLKNNSELKIRRGIILSGDQFITKKNYLAIADHMDKDTLCVEMESGAVGQCAFLLNVPFVCIRSISDIVTREDNGKMMDSNMEKSCTNSALGFLELVK